MTAKIWPRTASSRRWTDDGEKGLAQIGITDDEIREVIALDQPGGVQILASRGEPLDEGDVLRLLGLVPDDWTITMGIACDKIYLEPPGVGPSTAGLADYVAEPCHDSPGLERYAGRVFIVVPPTCGRCGWRADHHFISDCDGWVLRVA